MGIVFDLIKIRRFQAMILFVFVSRNIYVLRKFCVRANVTCEYIKVESKGVILATKVLYWYISLE